MKPVLLILYFFICLQGICQANPPVKKVYAFKQASIPGILPRLPENENQQSEERKQSYNYWFYLEIQPQKKIRITGLWIDGARSEIKAESVDELPVKKIIYSGGAVNDTVILVPGTRNKVMLVYPSATSVKPSAVSAYLRNLISTHELVISYTCNGKKYYAVAKKIRVLSPDAHA